MYKDKPITNTAEFTARIDVMNSWLNFKTNLTLRRQELDDWINRFSPISSSDNFQEDFDGVPQWNCKMKILAEQLMKEKNIESIFQKKNFLSAITLDVQTETTFYSLQRNFDKDEHKIFL